VTSCRCRGRGNVSLGTPSRCSLPKVWRRNQDSLSPASCSKTPAPYPGNPPLLSLQPPLLHPPLTWTLYAIWSIPLTPRGGGTAWSRVVSCHTSMYPSPYSSSCSHVSARGGNGRRGPVCQCWYQQAWPQHHTPTAWSNSPRSLVQQQCCCDTPYLFIHFSNTYMPGTRLCP
jgi:hypothetical protein